MKISSLLESQTPSSAISNTTSSAPVFGRDDEHLEECGTTSGAVASVASPVGGVQRRGKGSIFGGIKTSEKFPNSNQVTEEELEEASAAATASTRASLAKRKDKKPLSAEEQLAKDKAKSDKWLEKERAKVAAKKKVAEARVGNRMSDISIGSPKIVHYKGKAVGEVGLDHEASPGNGPYYFHHYLTGKAYVGYDTKQEALADLKHIVMQVDAKELEEGVWGDTAKLVGIPAVAGALAVGANHLDQQQPHVDIGGQSAKIIHADSTMMPRDTMLLKGADGKMYHVWMTSGKGSGHALLASPADKEVKEGRWSHNAKTGAKLHPKTGVELPAKVKPMAQPKVSAPGLSLDTVWRKVEDVVGQIYPDGDPIDYLAPWLEKQGIRDFKIGEVLAQAAKKNGYKDIYDYWNSFSNDLGEAFIAPALSAANANAEFERQRTFGTKGGGYKGRVKLDVEGKDDYINVKNALTQAAKKIGHHVECGLSGNQMSVFSDSMNSDELDNFIDNILPQMMEEAGGNVPSGMTWQNGKLQKRPELVAAARGNKNYQAYLKRKAAKEKAQQEKEVTENSMADFFAKAAQEKFPNALVRKNGEVVQEPPKREVPHAAQQPVDVQSLQQQLVDLEKRYEELGGDSWQYADIMMPRDREAQKVGQQIGRIKDAIQRAGSQLDEAELAEEMLASELYRDLQIFKKGKNKDIGSRAANKDLSGKPTDKEIIAKVTKMANEDKDPCWKGYKQIGMKKKNGKTVPNCVPKK